MTKTQIDRLGERLRKGDVAEADLRLLDFYRRSFAEAYANVVGVIRNELALEPTGRPAKSTSSILEKLQRESVRLSQIQDIAGCRVVVADIPAQERVLGQLIHIFSKAHIVDRREHPSHGYRAVHVVVNVGDKLIEVQIRTALQHIWAELSEKFSDLIDPTIKYGGGPEEVRELLTATSNSVANAELAERQLFGILAKSPPEDMLPDGVRAQIAQVRDNLMARKQDIAKLLQAVITLMPKGKGRKGAVPD